MKSIRWMERSLCAAASVVLAGCMYPGPYSYGTYPGYYSPPPGYAAPPGGTIVTPGPGPGFPSPQLGPSSGPPPTWSPTPAGPSPTLSPTPSPLPSTPPGNSTFDGAPPYNGGARKPTEIPVPNPIERDPGPMLGPSGQNPGPANTPFGSDGTKGSFGEGAQLTIPQRTEVAVHAVGTVDPQTFENPIDRDRSDRAGLVAVSARGGEDRRRFDASNPCDYDRASYSWLRGIVDFDSRDKSWHIIYSQKPDRQDRYGGAIRLVDHPKLGGLRSGDIVYVEGHIDTHHLDTRGKPQYRIAGDHIEPLTPGAPIQSMGN
jgi:hypothetical protein